jgi:L-ornithine N5-oxygenase
MSISAPERYDVIGIGFGPSGLSLAVALDEQTTGAAPARVAFFERQSAFGWHRNMLLPSAKMQVSFLKDLATFRNPLSRFSFVSYLHTAGRLPQFVNNQDFFPTRAEFHDYLEWAAEHFTDRVTYGAEVVGVRLAGEDCFAVDVRVDGAVRTAYARNVVVSTGLAPKMPVGIERSDQVWHSSEFIARFRQADPAKLRRVAVAGAGQSAAEIARFLYDALPYATVSAVIPSYGYSIADDTPFANEVFDPAAVDDHYFASDESRDAFWRYHRNTNYSVVDDEVIRDLYRRSYEDQVRGVRRLDLVRMARVAKLQTTGEQLSLTLHTMLPGAPTELQVDALVCATGYDTMQPTDLLGDLDRYYPRDNGRYRLERDYRLVSNLDLPGALYLQGGTEHTHGLSSSLLSNIAVRSGEIAESIRSRPARPGAALATAAEGVA